MAVRILIAIAMASAAISVEAQSDYQSRQLEENRQRAVSTCQHQLRADKMRNGSATYICDENGAMVPLTARVPAHRGGENSQSYDSRARRLVSEGEVYYDDNDVRCVRQNGRSRCEDD